MWCGLSRFERSSHPIQLRVPSDSIAARLASMPHAPYHWRVIRQLVLIGAGVGALVGAVLAGLWWAWPLGLSGAGAGIAVALMAGAPFGALVGVCAAPLSGMTVLRAVPLRAAVAGPAIGTLIGGVRPLFLSVYAREGAFAAEPVSGSLTGFAVGVLLTRAAWHVYHRRLARIG